VVFDKRPRYKSVACYLEQNNIMYDLLEVGNNSLLKGCHEISAKVRDFKPTHVILFGVERGGLFWLLLNTLLFRKKVIIRLGGEPIKVPQSRYENKKIIKSITIKSKASHHIRMLMIRFTLKIVTHYICVSKSLQKSQALISKQSFFIPVMPVNKKLVHRTIDCATGQISVLTVTNLNYFEKYQGVLQVVESMATLSLKVNVHLVIVGGGDYLPSLRAKVDAVKQANLRIEVRGYEKNLDEYYEAANFFVYHSVLDSWPNVLMEAMSYALPIVANNNNDFAEVFNDEQHGCLCEGSDSMANKVFEVFSDKAVYEKYSKLSLSRISDLQADKQHSSKFGDWLNEI